jgi:hypothetical protein
MGGVVATAVALPILAAARVLVVWLVRWVRFSAAARAHGTVGGKQRQKEGQVFCKGWELIREVLGEEEREVKHCGVQPGRPTAV